MSVSITKQVKEKIIPHKTILLTLRLLIITAKKILKNLPSKFVESIFCVMFAMSKHGEVPERPKGTVC